MAVLNRLLPVIYFFFVFFLYFSLLSEPYFTDEQDVFYGAYNIIKGKDIYRSFLSQHMPFSYYLAVPIALCGARTVFQFRFGIYLMLALLWEAVFLRHRKAFSVVSLFAMPLLYLTILKTLYMGTTMISDHWQGIGLVLILLELIRYLDTKEIPWPCALMVSLGIVLSLGASFASAYSLLCCFLGMVFIQIQSRMQERKSDQISDSGHKKKYCRENLRLVAVCLLPFLLLGGWYALSGNLENFYSGAYEIVTEEYSKYTGGLGSDPVSVVWETAAQYGAYLWGLIRNLGSMLWPNLLYLLSGIGLIALCIHVGRRSPFVGIMILLSAIYGGLRGFEGFHAVPYYAQAAMALSLCMGYGLRKWAERGRGARIAAGAVAGALAAGLLVNFVVWGGYNLLYPQILRDRTLRSEEEILALLTEPNEEVFVCNAPVNSLDVMDLELIPADACGAISYPYFYEMWGERQMASIQKTKPNVLLYNPEESLWGYVFREYAADFDAYVSEHYTRLPQAEEMWVSNDFLPEAARRLTEAGYGTRVISNVEEITSNRPVKYYAGQSVLARFTAEGENLSAIRFCAACFYRRSNPALTLRVREAETGVIAGEGRITGEHIADNFFSRCPMQAVLIPGKVYELEIVIDQIAGKGDMEFYYIQKGELALAVEYEDASLD